MKVGIYTDLHCAYTSSILPLACPTSSKYTTRLQMIIDTGKWLNELFTNNKVDMIVNGGDTCDSNILKSTEITALADFFKQFTSDIPHYVITGNHEILDEDSEFHATAILDGIGTITVINKPTKINDCVSVLPYMNSNNIDNNLLKSLSNNLLVSHIDIMGSALRAEYIMDTGVNPEMLAEYFDFVANGHLHTAEHVHTSKNNVWNIGSTSSVSFVDNNEYIPSAIIYDTDTKTFKRYENPYTILFRKLSADSVSDVINQINNLSDDHKYVVRITCPYDCREEIRQYLDGQSKVITYRVVSNNHGKSINLSNNSLLIKNLDRRSDMKTEFIKFLNKNSDSMKYPMKEYMKVLENI